MEGIIRFEESSQTVAGFFCLCPTFWGEFDSVVRNGLVYISIF